MPTSLYEVLWIFIIYAFIGWCTEVSYAALDRGIFVNRGFLNGPYCPIYGVGVFTVVVLLTPLKSNLIILYVGSFLLTSILEYITGFILEKVFHNKWWDYSDKPYNIKGYVCLKFSIFWGFACTFIMVIIHPIIYLFIVHMPKIVGIILISVLMVIFVVDCCVTVATILKFNKRLNSINVISEKIHILSDEIGENIYENVTEALEKKEKFEESHEELLNELENKKLLIAENIDEVKAELQTKQETMSSVKDEKKEKILSTMDGKKKEYENLLAEYKRLMEEKKFGYERILKAFPDMKSRENNEILSKMKTVHLPKRFKNKE